MKARNYALQFNSLCRKMSGPRRCLQHHPRPLTHADGRRSANMPVVASIPILRAFASVPLWGRS